MKSLAVTLLGSALIVFFSGAAQAQLTIFESTGNGYLWTDDTNWFEPSNPNNPQQSPDAIGSTAIVEINVFPSGGGIIMNTSGPATIVSLTYDSGVGGFIIEPSNIQTLQINGAITNNSGNMQTLSGTLIAGANATWDGGTGGLTLANVIVGTSKITTAGSGGVIVGPLTTLNFTINSATTFGSIGPITTSDETIAIKSTASTPYAGGTGDFFQLATGTLTNITADTSHLTLTAGLSWITTLINKGILFVEPTAGGTVINSGVVLPIDMDSEFNPNGAITTITFNGTTSAAELLTDNSEDVNNTPFTTTRAITINASSSAVIAAKNATTATYSGVISDAGGTAGTLAIGDATNHGTVVFSAANTYAGATSIASGATLQLGNANAVQNSTVTTNAANAITFGSGIGTFLVGGLSGTGNEALSDTAAAAVTLQVGNNNSTTTYSGILSGTGGALTKVGTGVLTVSGANTYTGATTVTTGTLKAGVASVANTSGAFGNNSAVTVGASGTLDINGFATQIGSLTGSGSVTDSGAAATLTTGGDNTSPAAFSGTISDGTNALALTKIGTGTEILSHANTYTGLTTVTGGTLKIGATNAIKSGNKLTTGASGIFDVAGNSQTLGLLSNGGNVTSSLAGGSLTIGDGSTGAGTVTGTMNVIWNQAATSSALTGGFTTTGNLTLNANGAGTIGITSANNTGTVVNAGTGAGAATVTTVGANVTGVTQNSNTSALTVTTLNPNAGGTTLTSGGTALLTVTNQVANSAGNLLLKANTTGGITLAGGANNIGTITNSGTGTGTSTVNGVIGTSVTNVTENSAGSQLVLNGANTYTGTTTVTAGTLKAGVASVANTSGAFGNNSAVTVGASGTLDINGFATQIGSLTGSGSVTDSGAAATLTTGGDNTSPAAFSGTISDGAGALALTKIGTGVETLSHANTYTGLTTVTGGTLKIGATNAIKSGNKLTTGASGIFDVAGNSQTLGLLSNGGNVTSSLAGGSLTIGDGSTGAGTVTGTMNVIWNQGATSSALTGGFTNTGNLTLNSNGAGTIGVTSANNTGTIVNAGTGAGAATVTTAGTNVTGVTQNSSTSALTVTTLNVNTGGTTLTSGGTALLTVTNQVANSAGNLLLKANSTGGITLAGGANNIGTITNSGTSTGTSTVGGVIGTSVTSVTENSAGSQLALNGANTFTGGLNIQQGTVKVGTTTGVGAGLVTIGAGGTSGTLDLNGQTETIKSLATAGTAANQTITNSSATAATVNYTGATTSTFGGVIKNGTGTTGVTINNGNAVVTLSGANTYTGATTVTAGTLNVTGSTAAGSAVGVNAGILNVTGNLGGAVTVANGATLMGSGNGTTTGVTGAVTVNNGGSINLATDSAIGTLRVGNLSATGAALDFEINVGGAAQVDKITAGTLTIGAGTTISLANLGGAANLGITTNTLYTLLTYTGAASGLGNLTLASNTLDGQTLTLVTSNSGLVQVQVSAPVSLTTYTLGSSAASTRILTSGTTTVTSTITNTGTADTLDFTNLNATASSGALTPTGANPLPQSGAALAASGGSASGTATFTAGGTAGPVTITPTVATATNTTLGGNSTLNGTTPTTINVVNQRTLTVGTPTIAEGRFLTTSTPAGTTAISSAGLNNVTGSASLGAFNGTNTNGLTLTTTDPTAFNGGTANQTANYTIGGTATAGNIAGSFSSTVTAELGSIAPVTVAVTGDAVNQRTFTVGTPTIALGRFLTTSTPAGTTAISSAGLNAVTANASLGTFTGTGTNGLTLTTTDPTAFNGATANQTANYTIGGTATAGNISGTFSSTVTAELGSIAPVTVAVTGDAVNQRTFSVGTPTIALGRFLVTSTPVGTTAISSAGLNAVTANAILGAFAATNTNGLTLTTTDATAFNGATANQTANYSIGGTATAGTISGSFSSTVTAELGSIAPVTVAVTGDAVNQRTFTVGTPTIALGRFLVSSTAAGTTAISSAGLNAVTANASLGAFTGTGTNGLTLTTTDPTAFNGATANQTANYNIGGTATAGNISGTFSSTVTAELGSIAPVTVAVTGDAVNQRTFSVGTPTIALGRFLVTSTPVGTTAISSAGLNAVTASATLGAFTATNTGGLTLTTTDPTAFNGAAANQTANYTIGGTATAGNISGSFSSTVTAEFGAIAPVTVNVTADAVNKRTITNGAVTDLGVLHSGGTVSGTSTAFSSTGLNATTTSVSVAAGSGVADVNGVKLTGAATTLNGAILTQTDTRTFAGTISSNTGGTVANTINLGVASLENGGAGLTGEGAYTSVGVGYTAFVYTGVGVYSAAGSSSWGTVSAAPTNWTANGGTPGLDANFTTTDSATFGNSIGATTATVSLDGDNPSLNAITFNNTLNGTYIIATGNVVGSTLKLNAGAGTAVVTNASGTNTISANMLLNSNTAIVNNGGLLTLSGNIGGASTSALTFSGAGTDLLSGANTFTGPTTITAGLLSLGSTNALTSSSSVTMTGGTLDINGNAQTLNNFSSTGGTLTNTGGGAPTVLTFFEAADPVNASNITGNVAVDKTGPGFLALTGNNDYTGGTTITAGLLQAGSANAFGTGALANNGGTLSAFGNEHAINVGIVGQANATSNYTQLAGGTLILNITAAPDANGLNAANDILKVTGQAALGGSLVLNFVPSGAFVPAKGQVFEIIATNLNNTVNNTNLTNGVTGAFATTTVNPAGFLIHLTTVIQPGDVVPADATGNNDYAVIDSVQLALTTVPGVTLTPNQASIANFLSTNVTRGALFQLISGVVATDPLLVPEITDQFNTVKTANFFRSSTFNDEVFSLQELDSYFESQRSAHGDFLVGNGQINSRGLTVVDPSMDPALALVGSRLLAWSPAAIGHGMLSDTASPVLGGIDSKEMRSAPESLSSHDFSTFVVGNVVLAQNFSQAETPHSDTTTGGVQIGADYRITPHLRTGVLFGYSHTDGDLDNSGSKATIDSYQPGVYVSFADNGWYANGVGSYGFNNYTEDRHVAIGTASAIAHGAPNGDQVTGNIDGGYDFHVKHWTFGPLAGLEYTHLNVNSYQEDGAGAMLADLTVNKQEADSLRSRLGGHVSYAYQTGKVLLTPHLDASWQHEFLDQSQGINAQLLENGPGSFTVTTPKTSRDSVLLDGGLNAELNGQVTVFGDYLIQAGQSNYFGQSVQAGVKIGF